MQNPFSRFTSQGKANIENLTNNAIDAIDQSTSNQEVHDAREQYLKQVGFLGHIPFTAEHTGLSRINKVLPLIHEHHFNDRLAEYTYIINSGHAEEPFNPGESLKDYRKRIHHEDKILINELKEVRPKSFIGKLGRTARKFSGLYLPKSVFYTDNVARIVSQDENIKMLEKLSRRKSSGRVTEYLSTKQRSSLVSRHRMNLQLEQRRQATGKTEQERFDEAVENYAKRSKY